MTESPDAPRRWPVIPTILVLAAAAAMVALGIWQLQRKGEKEALIALYERNRAMSSPVTYPKLPPVSDAFLFRKSSVVCLEVVKWDPRGGTDRKGQTGIRMIADCRTGAEGPGPLVATIGRAAGDFPIPVAIVPGHLSDDEIDALSG